MPNQRTKGNNYERYCANRFRKTGIFPECRTTRDVRQDMDKHGVDLWNTNNWYFQCKAVQNQSTARITHYLEVQMPKDRLRALIWKNTSEKSTPVESREYIIIKGQIFDEFLIDRIAFKKRFPNIRKEINENQKILEFISQERIYTVMYMSEFIKLMQNV